MKNAIYQKFVADVVKDIIYNRNCFLISYTQSVDEFCLNIQLLQTGCNGFAAPMDNNRFNRIGLAKVIDYSEDTMDAKIAALEERVKRLEEMLKNEP